MLEYKDKRKVVDDLKEALQKEIMEYTKLTEAGWYFYGEKKLIKYFPKCDFKIFPNQFSLEFYPLFPKLVIFFQKFSNFDYLWIYSCLMDC